jgi:hypothetical protein
MKAGGVQRWPSFAPRRKKISSPPMRFRLASTACKPTQVNIDDPLKQTKARMDLVTAMDQLEKMKAQVDADRRAISALQEEARRLSVPAGWIR